MSLVRSNQLKLAAHDVIWKDHAMKTGQPVSFTKSLTRLISMILISFIVLFVVNKKLDINLSKYKCTMIKNNNIHIIVLDAFK